MDTVRDMWCRENSFLTLLRICEDLPYILKAGLAGGDDTTGTGEPVAPSTPARGEGAECAGVPEARLLTFTLCG